MAIFNQTTVISWKTKFNNKSAANVVFKKTGRQTKYQKPIPEMIKEEDFATQSALKKFSCKYNKYTFSRITVNYRKTKFKNKNVTSIMFKA